MKLETLLNRSLVLRQLTDDEQRNWPPQEEFPTWILCGIDHGGAEIETLAYIHDDVLIGPDGEFFR